MIPLQHPPNKHNPWDEAFEQVIFQPASSKAILKIGESMS